ncbi:hypothetical protein PR048_009803 [Dryococelus australis]|uniref:C-type lectin domain-containing protein n=1 Tax=Dryococelus australis TaxID=614101 RepID=A0ABQ9I0Z3_9NEOP|nr:hypothetical protein PR048_009803 [Dryococelus australis]
MECRVCWGYVTPASVLCTLGARSRNQEPERSREETECTATTHEKAARHPLNHNGQWRRYLVRHLKWILLVVQKFASRKHPDDGWIQWLKSSAPTDNAVTECKGVRETGATREKSTEERAVNVHRVSYGTAVVVMIRLLASYLANRVHFLAWTFPDVRMWESCRVMPLVGRFSRGIRLPPSFHTGTAPYSPLRPHQLSTPRCFLSGRTSTWVFSECSHSMNINCEYEGLPFDVNDHGAVNLHYRLLGEESFSRNDDQLWGSMVVACRGAALFSTKSMLRIDQWRSVQSFHQSLAAPPAPFAPPVPPAPHVPPDPLAPPAPPHTVCTRADIDLDSAAAAPRRRRIYVCTYTYKPSPRGTLLRRRTDITPADLEHFSAFETEKRWSEKGDTATSIKCAIAAKRKAPNWRAVQCITRHPPRRAGFDFRRGRSPDILTWDNRGGRCHWSAKRRLRVQQVGLVPTTGLLSERDALSRLGAHSHRRASTAGAAVRDCPALTTPLYAVHEPAKVIEVSMKQRRNERAGKTGDPEETRRPTALSGTIPTCEDPGVARPGIGHGSLCWEASRLTAQPPQPLSELYIDMVSGLMQGRGIRQCQQQSSPRYPHAKTWVIPPGIEAVPLLIQRSASVLDDVIRAVLPIPQPAKVCYNPGTRLTHVFVQVLPEASLLHASMEQRRNERVEKREIPEKTRRPNGIVRHTFPTCENLE